MTRVWMGLTTVAAEERAGNPILTSDAGLKRTAQQWLGFSVFAEQRKNQNASAGMRVG